MKLIGACALILCATTTSACFAGYHYPTRSIDPALPTAVSASYDRTWEAVVTYFADHRVVIKTIEKASGLIVAQPIMPVFNNREPVYDAKGKLQKYTVSAPVYVDCGGYYPVHERDPNWASYTVRILGDSSSSRVQIVTRFTATGVECVSNGKFENEMQQVFKSIAEVK